MAPRTGSKGPRDLLGRDVRASDGAKLGHVADVYVDAATGAPKWLVLRGSVLSDAVSFVPADGASEDDRGRVITCYSRRTIRRAPHPEADGELSPEEESRLAQHYIAAPRKAPGRRDASADDDLGRTRRIPSMADGPTIETPMPPGADDTTEEFLSDPSTSTDESMVRSEEELRAAAVVRPSRRARLVKQVVTEPVTFTVPVRREVLTLEYEDLDPDEPIAGGDIPFAPIADQEFVLYGEIVEYETRVVPKERVRLQKEVVPEVVDLRADLRKEVVELEDEHQRV